MVYLSEQKIVYTGYILTMQFGLSRGDYRLSTTTLPLRSTTFVFSIG
jgi:hypothetical protein